MGNTISYISSAPPGRNFAYGVPAANVGTHEQAHTWQYQVFGPLFAPAYFISGEPFTLNNNFEFSANEFGAGRGGWFPW